PIPRHGRRSRPPPGSRIAVEWLFKGRFTPCSTSSSLWARPFGYTPASKCSCKPRKTRTSEHHCYNGRYRVWKTVPRPQECSCPSAPLSRPTALHPRQHPKPCVNCDFAALECWNGESAPLRH